MSLLWIYFPVVHSFDYEDAGYEAANLIKMDFLLNGQPVEELATIVHKQVLIFLNTVTVFLIFYLII